MQTADSGAAKWTIAIAVFSFLVAAVPAWAGPEQDKAAIEKMVGEWARAWEKTTASMDPYQGFYAKDFYSGYKDMDYEEWMADKKARGKKVKCIEVEVSDISMELRPPSSAVVTFSQIYKSNTYCDKGPKVLFVEKREGKWVIVAEEQEKATQCKSRCK